MSVEKASLETSGEIDSTIQEYLISCLTGTASTSNLVIPNDAILINTESNDTHDELINLLQSWNMSMEVITKFISLGIDIESLKFMKLRHIEDCFPKSLIGLKIKFEHHLFTWQKEMGTYESPTCHCSVNSHPKSDCFVPPQTAMDSDSTQTTRSDPSSSPKSLPYFFHPHLQSTMISLIINVSLQNVLQILNSTEEGKSILKFYNEKKFLEPQHRTALTHLIIQKFIEKGINLSVSKCKDLAKQILEIFPSETESSYFIGRGKLSPKGKLYDRYQNRKKIIKKMNPKFKNSTNMDTEQTEASDHSEQSVVDSEIIRISNVLKHLREPWNAVKEKWLATRSYRMQQILACTDSSINAIIKEWPLYTHASSPELIDMDFEYLYPDKSLYKNWQSIIGHILPIYKRSIKDAASKTLISDFIENEFVENVDFKNVCYVQLLHAILKPSQKVSSGKARIKYSIKHSQDSLMVTVRSAEEIIAKVQKKIDLCLINKLKLQPVIFGVLGEDKYYKEYFVYIDNIKFKFQNFLSALDMCFKIFQVFHLSYPKESSLVWNFIQRFLYEINTKYDDDSPIIATLINDINNSINRNEL